MCISFAVTLRVLPALTFQSSASADRLFPMVLKINRSSNSAFCPAVFALRVVLTINSDCSFTSQFTHLSNFIKISSDCIPPNTELQIHILIFIPVLQTQTVYFPSSYFRLSPTRHISSYLYFARRREGEKLKVKFTPRTAHEGPDGECRYRFTPSLTSALDGGHRHAPAALPRQDERVQPRNCHSIQFSSLPLLLPRG